MKLKRIRDGIYETSSGSRRIFKVEHDQVGPLGGNQLRWESAYFDAVADCWVIDGEITEPTLRQAKAELYRREVAPRW